jgi:2-polyprenyl-6-methoxyphenol hydroxylase-like FAD-dependent oxidoreductase
MNIWNLAKPLRRSISSTTISSDICIVGGGIVGMATACSIAKSRFGQGKKITLLEANHLFQDAAIEEGVYSNRVSSLTSSSVSFLKGET